MDLMEIIRNVTVAGVLAYGWYQERESRIRAETRADKERELNATLARESIATAIKTENTLETLASIITGPGRAA